MHENKAIYNLMTLKNPIVAGKTLGHGEHGHIQGHIWVAGTAVKCGFLAGFMQESIQEGTIGKWKKIHTLWSGFGKSQKVRVTTLHGCQFPCCSLAAKSGLTFCDPKDCSLPGSSVHGISQGIILEWFAISFSKGIFLTQGWNPGLWYWQVGSLPLAPSGKPVYILVWPKRLLGFSSRRLWTQKDFVVNPIFTFSTTLQRKLHPVCHLSLNSS